MASARRLRRRLGEPAQGQPGVPAARRGDAGGASVPGPVRLGSRSREPRGARGCPGGNAEEARGVREVLSEIERWRGRGERVAIATVIATRKSAPRPVGSKLAVSERGEMAGSVSGGCVENEVFGQACEILEGAA